VSAPKLASAAGAFLASALLFGCGQSQVAAPGRDIEISLSGASGPGLPATPPATLPSVVDTEPVAAATPIPSPSPFPASSPSPDPTPTPTSLSSVDVLPLATNSPDPTVTAVPITTPEPVPGPIGTPAPGPTPEPANVPEPEPMVPVLQEEPMTFERALDIAAKLAPDVVVPSDCQPPPLDRPELLPNSARGYRWGTHHGVDFPCWGGDDNASAVMDGRVIVAVGDYQTPSSAELTEVLEVTRQLKATPPYTLIMLYGNYVVLDHSIIDGVGHVVSIYAHLESLDPTVRIGELVEAGQPLGIIGNSGGIAGRICPTLEAMGIRSAAG